MSRTHVVLAGIVGLATAGLLFGYFFDVVSTETVPVKAEVVEPKPAEPSEEDLYAQKYLKEYEALGEQDPALELEGLEVTENTPDGEVVMESNGTAGSFRYWSDSKTIKFEYLDTVARGFCVAHKCKDQHAKDAEPAERCADIEKDKTNGVFVAYKQYNTKPDGRTGSANQSIRNQFKYMGKTSERQDKVTADSSQEAGIEYRQWVSEVG